MFLHNHKFHLCSHKTRPQTVIGSQQFPAQDRTQMQVSFSATSSHWCRFPAIRGNCKAESVLKKAALNNPATLLTTTKESQSFFLNPIPRKVHSKSRFRKFRREFLGRQVNSPRLAGQPIQTQVFFARVTRLVLLGEANSPLDEANEARLFSQIESSADSSCHQFHFWKQETACAGLLHRAFTAAESKAARPPAVRLEQAITSSFFERAPQHLHPASLAATHHSATQK